MKIKNILEYFIFQHGVFTIIQLFNKHVLKLPLYHSIVNCNVRKLHVKLSNFITINKTQLH
jgi:hypothetical protein